MKILVNCATLVNGGGVQVGLGFIKSVLSSQVNHEFLFLVSSPIVKELPLDLSDRGSIIEVKRSPGTIIGWFSFIFLARNAEANFRPDLVYSIGYPSYFKFDSIEVGRYTNPWEFYPEPLPWDVFSSKYSVYKKKLINVLRRAWARSADYIETQTYFSKVSIAKKLNYDISRIYVISNVINPEFYAEYEKNSQSIDDKLASNSKYQVLCISADHPHKNLRIIPKVVSYLNKTNKIFVKFVLTLPLDSNTWRDISSEAEELLLQDQIVNVGVLSIDECIYQYKLSTLVFLPSLLEVFSATYLEAMAMRVPIVTSDMPFAREICQDAAIYVDTRDVEKCANSISEILSNNKLFSRSIIESEEMFMRYPDPDERLKIILRMFEQVKQHSKLKPSS